MDTPRPPDTSLEALETIMVEYWGNRPKTALSVDQIMAAFKPSTCDGVWIDECCEDKHGR